MANNYQQFSESITDLTPEAKAWCKKLLDMEVESEEEIKELEKELSLEGDHGLDLEWWPGFGWELRDSSLWLYSEEGCDTQLLAIFVRELICRFMPDYIFSMSTADYCSKLRIGEFGGTWMVISREGIEGGSTWGAAEEVEEAIRKRRGDV
jgi:hypothetical protein